MKDRIPLYPGRVKLNPVSGQPNTFDMVRADDPTQAGTPLKKSSLLKDATAALYGLGTGAVPDDVLAEIGKYKLHWWRRRPKGAHWEYLQSSDRNAYPDSGTQDGYEYEYLGIPFDNAATGSKIETGSYVGTGTFGQANPNTLTFAFVPKIVIVFGPTAGSGLVDPLTNYSMILTRDAGFSGYSASNVIGYHVVHQITGGTISWYTQNIGSSGAGAQGNIANSTYNYIAIG